jgi:hypothetical protein
LPECAVDETDSGEVLDAGETEVAQLFQEFGDITKWVSGAYTC